MHIQGCIQRSASCIILHFHTPNPAVLRVKTVYLQSLQEAEVLKGSPLHDADLIVLQMTVAADRERERETHRSMLLNIITETKKNQTTQKQNQQKRFRGTAKTKPQAK